MLHQPALTLGWMATSHEAPESSFGSWLIAVGHGLDPRMYEPPDRTSLIDAILQCPSAELSGGPVRMVAQFSKQNLGQIFAMIASRQDHKCKQICSSSADGIHIVGGR